MRFYFTLLVLVPFYLFANETILINSGLYGIDVEKKMIVANKDVMEINANYPTTKTNIVLNSTYYFENPIESIEKGIVYKIFESTTHEPYTLYFTEFPLINIHTEHTIMDSPKVLGEFVMAESNENVISSLIGIEYRGSFSQTYPKKSLEIEFWEDEEGEETLDFNPLGMRSDDDWNLQALFNEPLRLRSKSANQIWKEFHTLSYADLEPSAVNGIEMRYVELFVNNEYRGIYAMGEKVDRKQLKLKNHNGDIRGELYKGDAWGNGAVTFSWIGEYDNSSDVWDGFEYKHPDEEIDWINLYNLIDFVLNASDEEFNSNYSTYFDVDNLVDYFIFLNLTRATDNTGKNTYLAKYNTDQPYFYVPWDLDGVFGNIFDGSPDNTTNDILMNNLFERVWKDCSGNGFKQKVKERWNTTRENLFSYESLMSIFEANYSILNQNLVYERENIAWNQYELETDQMTYLATWLGNRLSYLDVVFNEDCFMNTEEVSLTAVQMYPNPAQNILNFKWNSTLKANVSIYALTGQKVFQKELENESSTLDISTLSSGVYLVQISLGTEVQTKKLIINRN